MRKTFPSFKDLLGSLAPFTCCSPAVCCMHQQNKSFINSKSPDCCRIVIPTHNTWPRFLSGATKGLSVPVTKSNMLIYSRSAAGKLRCFFQKKKTGLNCDLLLHLHKVREPCKRTELRVHATGSVRLSAWYYEAKWNHQWFNTLTTTRLTYKTMPRSLVYLWVT